MAQRATSQACDDDTPGTIYPLQFVHIEDLEILAPLARISTCGGLTLEVLEEVISLDPPQGRYVLLTPRRLYSRHKGYRTGMGLLKVLSSQPGYFGAKDWIIENLQARKRARSDEDEEEIWGGVARLDNIVSILRGLLCPTGTAGEITARKRLVEWVPATPQSGAGYRLASWPLLWLDMESIEETIKQAS